MVVAVPFARVVQVSVDEIVDVVTMGHGFVSAVGAMDVVRGVRATVVLGSAIRGVGRVDVERVLVDVVSMRMVQMPVVQVIHVTLMGDRGVPTVVAVLVCVCWVLGAVGHFEVLLCCDPSRKCRRLVLLGRAFVLECVIQSVLDQLQNVSVREGVIDVPAVSTALDEPLASK